MTVTMRNLPSTAQMKATNLAHHWQPFTDTAELTADELRVMTHASGCHVWDSDGNQLLDGMAGLWCVNVGYGRNRIVDAVARQMRDLPYYNTFFKTTHPPVLQLAEKIASITPGDLNRVFLNVSGSDSNDTVLRMVRNYWEAAGKPEKKVVISRKNAYHGSTISGVSLGGMSAMRAQGGPTIPDIVHIDQPYWFGEGGDMDPDEFGIARAQALETEIDRLGGDKVAAFIAEPIQGAGGVIIPPDTYWPEVMRICNERDILFVADEVICGFGRLGEWFGSVHYDLQPDLISMAKGLSSGYLPIGAVAVSEKVAQVIFENTGEFIHGYTYSGHPASCAAALENLAIFDEEDLIGKVREDTGPYLAQKWASLGEHPLVGEARCRGMMAALELVPDKSSRERFENLGNAGSTCRNHSFANGLIMRAVRDTTIVSPPLTLSHDEIDKLTEIAWKSLDQTMAEVR